MITSGPSGPIAHARVGAALLLENESAARALWQGRPAVAASTFFESDESRAYVALARAIGTAPPPLAPVRLAAIADEPRDGAAVHARTVVVYEQDGGVTLDEALAHVAENRVRQQFPLDVACRLALWMNALTTWMPRISDFTITWDGRLCASPMPYMRHAGALIAPRNVEIIYLSPETARGNPMQPARDALYASGMLLFDLLAGAPPFHVAENANMLEVLVAVMGPSRIPFLQRRAGGVDASFAAVVDSMVAVHGSERMSRDDARAALAARACSDDEAARFLAGFLAEAFADERAADFAFWEEARTLDPSRAPEWRVTERVAAATDIADTWRRLSNRSSRTD